MEKKDIYEHLAKIYLDASSKKQKKSKDKSLLRSNLIIGISFLSVIIILISTIIITKNKVVSERIAGGKVSESEFSLALGPGIVKINFNFNPAQKETYSVNLNRLDLRRFKVLGFSARKAHHQDNIIFKVQFTNAHQEASELYLSNLPSYRWKDYRLSLSEFKGIRNWSELTELSFIVEAKGNKDEKGIVYIDNVRFIK